MIEFDSLYRDLSKTRLHTWVAALSQQMSTLFAERPHGKMPEWQQLLQSLPPINTSHILLDKNIVTIGNKTEITTVESENLGRILKQFCPWRKGPYNLFDIHIDTEWHSDWKWQRLEQHISPLQHRLVLDVGCGNGYHAWRMLGAGADLVIGADPSQFFLAQFQIMKHYAGDLPIHLLPLRGEDLPDFRGQGFDTVFSMGVLYHRKSPISHLQELKSFLRPGGELVLETLIVEGDDTTILLPENRYAKMRNVWFIPSTQMLERWLQRAGFENIHLVDVNVTSTEEQRATEWMKFESLADFLDPQDSSVTIEKYPAPTRAIMVCSRPF
jgi:tRNA (mo5U34)-methyltransferase